MGRLLLYVFIIAVIVGVPVARWTIRKRRHSPELRPWLVAAAVGTLIAVGFAVPHLDDVIPNGMRESPAGIFPFILAAAVLCVIAVAAVAVIVGATLPIRPDGDGA